MDPEEGEKGDGRGGGREERGREGRTGARPRGGSREVTRVTSHLRGAAAHFMLLLCVKAFLIMPTS